MTHCIAFHSYKGGTGKTTIAANAAASFVKMGKKVAILDLDVYAPSLHDYFKINPKKWINDFLENNANLDETIIDITQKVFDKNGIRNLKGRLYTGFSNPSSDTIFKFETGIGTDFWKKQFRKLVFLREQIITKLDVDYIIIDTSPGIRHWSINALSIADKLILTMKMDDLDIEGTKKLLFEIYTTFARFGAVAYILLNRVSGYCVPANTIPLVIEENQDHNKVLEDLHKVTGAKPLSPLACYCDIQFSPREFLTVVNNPNHPFSIKLQNIINEMTENNRTMNKNLEY